MNVGAAVARLLDVGARKPWRITMTTEPRGRRAPVATLDAAVICTPERGAPKCPHCGARAR